jgi:hypothetical protein
MDDAEERIDGERPGAPVEPAPLTVEEQRSRDLVKWYPQFARFTDWIFGMNETSMCVYLVTASTRDGRHVVSAHAHGCNGTEALASALAQVSAIQDRIDAERRAHPAAPPAPGRQLELPDPVREPRG